MSEEFPTFFIMKRTDNVDNRLNPSYCHEEWDRDLGEYQSTNLQNLLTELYKQKGLIDVNGDATSICDECIFSKECYAGCEERKPNLARPEWSHISIPWVGKNYSKNKIAVLGINPNEDGGLRQLYKLIDQAKKELSEGKTKVDFGYVFDRGERKGEKYSGTFLWHRMAAYTKAIKNALSCKSKDTFTENELMKRENFAPQKVINEFDRIAYLNQIKCSPLNELSKPTNKMWINCGRHILLEELKILKPNYLLVLGTGENMWALVKHVLADDITQCKTLNKIKYFKTKAFGTTTKIIVVPHPSAPAIGADTDYYQDIFDTVQLMKSFR